MEPVNTSQHPERRQNPRKPVTRPALLTHTRLGRQAGWITDISLDGVFVRSDWKDLPTFTAVEVTVTLSSGKEHRVREYRLPATMTRSTEDGIGLRFQSLNMESYSALLELLYSK